MKIGAIALALIMVLSARAADKSEKNDRLSTESLPAGYALLYKLLSDEKNVSKLLIVKKERSELHNVIKQISEVAGKAHKTLEKDGKHAGLNLENQHLPEAELAARESISKEKASELLHAKGDEFEFDLLMAQSEALTYGIHLSRVLSSAETNTNRREWLLKTAEQFETLRQQVSSMMKGHALKER